MSKQIKKQIILGLDPGFADTGFGVLEKNGNQLTFLEAGSIKTKAKTDFSERLEIIYQEINKLVLKWQPDLVAIEKLYFARNVTNALDVGQARGVVLLALIQNHCQILEFTPLQIKQALTGSGAASKRQVGLMVKSLLKIKEVPKPDDAADAVATAICGAFFNKRLSL
ncbi:crossover junction endodeoxyribonuclease RuvC [Candidatus Nomurabacteria bacterium]|nr:crossover junction endodeoxyribonuclease RuvC [Candidatus Nomurabacteria bacterium]